MVLSRTPPHRADFPLFKSLQTRWADNDIYGHVNNVTYYAYFDTVINEHLITAGQLDIHTGGVIGLVVESKCQYFASLAFPDQAEAGIRVDRVGTSSVTYAIGIFRPHELHAVALGSFVHVFVDRRDRRPVSLPKHLHDVLKTFERSAAA
jgi:acyl-CoA thioester hydrolase